MGFTSKIYPGEIIINDTTSPDLYMPTRDRSGGLRLPFSRGTGYAYTDLAGVEPFPDSLLIPQSEWQARIQELEETKTNLSSLITAAQLPYKDQDGTNYCWINGPCGCCEVMRMLQNQPYVELSAASAGAVIRQFRNEGGWGKEGLEFVQDRGFVPVSLWPVNAISKQYDKPESWAVAKQYRQTEWYELQPRNLAQQVSAALRRMPMACGFNWWSHEVYFADAVWIDGTAAMRIRNSWGKWGENGFGILQGQKMLSDDTVGPRVMVAA